jgi:uncharacterized protein YjaZ
MINYTLSPKKETINLFIFSNEIDKTIQEIPFVKKIGYAGFKERNKLKELLTSLGVDEKNGEFLEKNKDNIKNLVEEALKKCSQFFNDKRYIFIFPTSDEFVAEKMGGINGFTSQENTILIFINPTKKWKENLKNVLVHEIAHTISGYSGNNKYTLGESLVYEGIAENFRMELMGERAPWTEAITKEKSKKIFREIKSLLDKEESYEKLFFGTGKYPNWAGYTIGYYLVKDYLNKKFQGGNVIWEEVFKTEPSKFLNWF